MSNEGDVILSLLVVESLPICLQDSWTAGKITFAQEWDEKGEKGVTFSPFSLYPLVK